MGQHHAKHYAALAREGVVDFVGLYDANPARAKTIAAQYGVTVLDSVETAMDCGRCGEHRHAYDHAF